MEIKAKINKWDLIKLKRSCTKKETTSKVKRQLSEWEKISNNTPNKELISKIYRQFMQLNTRKTSHQIRMWAGNLDRYFTEEDILMANKHMKRFST